MEEFAIAERRKLRKILGPIKEGDQYRMRHNNGLYKVSRKLQILLEKEELLSDGHLQ